MNKESELVALNGVYNTKHFAKVAQRESPDFILQYSDGSTVFGVEITELYYTESDARLKNLPWYTDHLLGGGAFIHKNDKKIITVSPIDIFDKDGEIKASGITAVARKIPPIAFYSDQLASTIERKDKKMGEYLKGLNHVNLIINDMENPLRHVEAEDLCEHLFRYNLREAVSKTCFNEIYLITEISNQRRVYIPLRLLLLLADYYLFDWALGEYYDSFTYDSTDSILLLFAEFFTKRGVNISVKHTEGHLGIQLGNSIIKIREGGGIDIIDVEHRVIPYQSLSLGVGEHSDKLTQEFTDFFREYIQKHTFRAAIAFDVLNAKTI